MFSALRVSLKEGHFDGVFVASTFQDMEWYWGLFNMAIFVGRAIENGIFRDTSFADCRIVQFGFKKMCFLKDNLDGACSAYATCVYDCWTEDCEGVGKVFPALTA